MSDQIRLLVVEDVPQVAQYIRGLLNSQQAIKLLDVVSDGTRVLNLISELRPDVVLVDALLQGRVKGLNLVDQIHQSGAHAHPSRASPAVQDQASQKGVGERAAGEAACGGV